MAFWVCALDICSLPRAGPCELLTTMLCVGPSFKQGEVVRHHGRNRWCHGVLAGFGSDSGIDGRVLAETFRQPNSCGPQVHEFTYRSQLRAGDSLTKLIKWPG